jgi:large subunit ribosomal protein L10
MARPDKATAVAELTDEFRSSSGAVLTEYRGLTVKQLQDLRRALGDNATYAVVKNTLTKIAAKEAGVEAFDDLLTGPSAIAFIKGDPVETAKSLRDFARANSPLVIKGGILDGKPLTVAEIAKIADLESRDVLLAKLAGALMASLQNAAYLFNAPLAKMAQLGGALQAKVEAEGPADGSSPAATGDAPTPDEAAPEATDVESSTSDDASSAAASSDDASSDVASSDDASSDDASTADETAAEAAAAEGTAPEAATGEESPEA